MTDYYKSWRENCMMLMTAAVFFQFDAGLYCRCLVLILSFFV